MGIMFRYKEEQRKMQASARQKIISTLAVIIVVALIGGVLYGCSDSQVQSNTADPKISVKEAKEAALLDAGVSPSKTLITRRKLVDISGTPQYLINFVTQTGNNTVRYQYTIDGMEGNVTERSKQIRTFASVRVGDETSTEEHKQGDEFIGVAKAKAAILEDTGLDEKEMAFKVVRLESRREMDIYVVEFESMGISYLFNLDAVSGTIVSREVRFDD